MSILPDSRPIPVPPCPPWCTDGDHDITPSADGIVRIEHWHCVLGDPNIGWVEVKRHDEILDGAYLTGTPHLEVDPKTAGGDRMETAAALRFALAISEAAAVAEGAGR